MGRDTPEKPSWQVEEELEKLALPLKTATAQPKPKGESLCYRCRNSMIYRRASSFDNIIRCNSLPNSPEMPHDIRECSEYTSPTQLSLCDMGEMAWRVDDREEPLGPYR